MGEVAFYSKEITLNKSIDDTYGFLLDLPKLSTFSILSENKVMNKIIIGFSKDKIEVSLDKVDNDRTRIHISALDSDGNYYKPNEIATNIVTNFENGLTCVISGELDRFTIQAPKVEIASSCLQMLLLLAGIVAVIYGLYVLVTI